VRAAAKIDKFPSGVKRNHGLGRFFFHELALKSLIGFFVQLERFRLGQKFAFVWQVLRRKLAHFGFNLDQVFRSEWFFTQKFIEKSCVDGRTDTKLDVRKKLRNRGSKQMRGGMTKNVQSVSIFFRQDLQLHIVVQRTTQIDQFAVVYSFGIGNPVTGGDARHKSGVGKARRYFARNFQRSSAPGHFLNFAIG
jgi:hypothetical protein